MDMDYRHLDTYTRALMKEEVQFDVDAERVDLGKRLTSRGEADYLGLLFDSIKDGDHQTFAQQLQKENRMERREQTSRGYIRVPRPAATTKALGAFNHYYMRAICRRALANCGTDAEVRVYRAGPRRQKRLTSQNVIGTSLQAADLLRHWQTQPQEESPPGLPIGWNSGLSLELID